MKCYVFVLEPLPLNGADLCIVLGNFLDNAIETVDSLLEVKRHIEVFLSQVKGSLSIMMQPPYEWKIIRNGNGRY